MRAFVGLVLALATCSAASADELVGSIHEGLFGYGGHSPPGGVYFGFDACAASPGANSGCLSPGGGASPAFTLGSIGFVPASTTVQTFTVDGGTDPTFPAVAAAMETTPFNWGFDFHYGDAGTTVAFPSYAEGGVSRDLAGYWQGSVINSVQVVVHPFDFVPVDLGANGGVFYALRNLDGFEFPAGGNLAIVELNFYGTRGKYQQPAPSGTPEPGTWLLMMFGLGTVGALARRRRAAPSYSR